MVKIKLPKGSRTLSGEHLMDRHGGEMWDELKEWLNSERIFETSEVQDKMKQIENEHGIHYVE